MTQAARRSSAGYRPATLPLDSLVGSLAARPIASLGPPSESRGWRCHPLTASAPLGAVAKRKPTSFDGIFSPPGMCLGDGRKKMPTSSKIGARPAGGSDAAVVDQATRPHKMPKRLPPPPRDHAEPAA